MCALYERRIFWWCDAPCVRWARRRFLPHFLGNFGGSPWAERCFHYRRMIFFVCVVSRRISMDTSLWPCHNCVWALSCLSRHGLWDIKVSNCKSQHINSLLQSFVKPFNLKYKKKFKQLQLHSIHQENVLHIIFLLILVAKVVSWYYKFYYGGYNFIKFNTKLF